VTAVRTRQAGVALVVAQSLESNEHALSKLGLVMFLFGLAGVIAAALAGWMVARNGLRPVRRLTDAAEDIARTEKLDPIEVQGNDEIARLASAFNSMLAALSASRDRQRQLVADAGHELRTPLTSLRTNLELLSQADRQGGLSDASRAELLDDVRFQIEELTTLIGDLTELAREQPPQVNLEQVDLAEITDRAVQRVRRRAISLAFDVHVEPWWVVGEASALERAVTNLLDNAAKWSPPLGVVTVRLQHGSLLVADQGEGIREEDAPHVFDRFYRSPESRTMPGSGLGLSIVRQVAERHGGTVRVGRSEDGGAAFWFDIPGSPEQPGMVTTMSKDTLSTG
jgi:two-component system sensor histidine kinase MprB